MSARSCDIKRLYLLVRDDAAKPTGPDRLQQLISSALFASLRKSKPRFPQLIQLVTGDLSAVGLGLSAADRATLCAQVQLIVHAGAGARFTDRLADATLTNVRGTQQLLQLAKQMPGLQGLAHVSTVFAPAVPSRGPLEEHCYRTTVRPEGLISVVEGLLAAGQVAELDLLAAHLMRPWPNAYTFTMALAERLVQEAADAAALPAVVVRTSVVLSTLEDPTAGYTCSASGINGLMIAITTGAMRVLPAKADRLAPVCLSDYAVNVTLAAMHRRQATVKAAATASTAAAPATVDVYNATVQHDDLRWGSVCAGMVRNANDNPLLGSVWTPRVHLLSACPYQVWWFVWMYEVLPGLMADVFLRTVGCGGRIMPRVRRNEEARQECGFVLAGEWATVSERAKELFER